MDQIDSEVWLSSLAGNGTIARTRSRLCAKVILAALFIALSQDVSAQCSMCRDSTAGSSPRTRSSLRIAIPVLGIPAVLIFCGVFWVAFCRSKQEEQ